MGTDDSSSAIPAAIDWLVNSLGHNINIGDQNDREAVGNALIKDLRNTSSCVSTGSIIAKC